VVRRADLAPRFAAASWLLGEEELHLEDAVVVD
jgi:hypothetical protein